MLRAFTRSRLTSINFNKHIALAQCVRKIQQRKTGYVPVEEEKLGMPERMEDEPESFLEGKSVIKKNVDRFLSTHNSNGAYVDLSRWYQIIYLNQPELLEMEEEPTIEEQFIDVYLLSHYAIQRSLRDKSVDTIEILETAIIQQEKFIESQETTPEHTAIIIKLSFQATVCLGRIQESQKDYLGADLQYERAMKLEPENKRLMYDAFSLALNKLKDHDRAAEIMEQLVETFKWDAEVHVDAAKFYVYTKLYKEAADMVQKARDLRGPPVEVNMVEAEILYKLGNASKAIELLEESVEEDPQDERPQKTLGVIATRSGQFEKGFNTLRGVIKANKDQPCYVYSACAVSQHLSGQPINEITKTEIQKNFDVSVALLQTDTTSDNVSTSLPILADYAHYLLDVNKNLSNASELLHRCYKIDSKDPWTLYGFARMNALDQNVPFQDVKKSFKEAIKNVSKRIENDDVQEHSDVSLRYSDRLIRNSFSDYANFIIQNNAQEEVPTEKIYDVMNKLLEHNLKQNESNQ
ncbi:TPR repeat-containing protein [Acrasis kona]|uniref:TPR repeat-containing protein n=1 Tax=Acrasis kona TaxID=1008807 RepID=A0AAW2ZE80_9EUKA